MNKAIPPGGFDHEKAAARAIADINEKANTQLDDYNKEVASRLAARSAVEFVFGSSLFPFKVSFHLPFSRQKSESKQTLEDEKSALVERLVAAKIDPIIFDSLVANEIDRRLKTKFGITFVVLTTLFTAASYAIVVCNGPFGLQISEVAITGLIIETPLQFIGLLYIIARNLFPVAQERDSLTSVALAKLKPTE